MSLSVANLDPNFAKRVQQLLDVAAARKWGISLVSAFRSFNEQQILYNKLKPRGLPVATPGNSCHQFGAAIDVTCRFGFSSPQFSEFAATARVLRIENPVRNDPGHFQDTVLCNERRQEARGPRGSIARNSRPGSQPEMARRRRHDAPAPDCDRTRDNSN